MKAFPLTLLVCLTVMFLYGQNPGNNHFVKIEDLDFVRAGKTYHFLGANLWYGMNLGAEGKTGDRKRLIKELDKLSELGVTNLRILGSSEGAAGSKYQIVPTLQTSPGEYDEALWKGLDFLLSEMGKREMTAVVCLNNFWMWSGGMPQYLSWANGSRIPLPDIENGSSWDDFIAYSQSFFSDKEANRLFRDHLEKLINRTNSLSGIKYKDDPTIMAWQLANEPRGYNTPRVYQKWIHKTAKYIKSLDRNHLISVGSEGNTGSSKAGVDLFKDNRSKHVDYATVHVWIQNWSWYDPKKPKSFQAAINKSKRYLEDQLAKAQKLGKPVVLEEFGVSRDGGDFDPQALTSKRDSYYEFVFSEALGNARNGGLIKGCNFWSWGGEGRPVRPGEMWKEGDDLIGDPPHERQGWYSVYDHDHSTLNIIKKYASLFNNLVKDKGPVAER